MTTPETFNIGAQAGTNISRGIRQGLENRAIGQILQQAQQIQDPNELNNIMNQVLPRFSPQGQQVLGQAVQRQQQQMQQQQAQRYLESQGVDPETSALGQPAVESFLKQKAMAATEAEKEKKMERSDLRRAQIKSEYESPEVKEYRKNLGLREDIASQLVPALSNARQFENDPSRFVPGTRASKSLGDLATRAFGFYKPLFGGRLTQREFTQSIKNLAANKATPGGFNQALNLIESMITQAELEGEKFSELLNQGVSPLEARRQTRQAMKGNVDIITNVLQGGSPQATTKGFAKLPPPTDFKDGQKIKDKETGDTFIIEGGVWKRERRK